MNKKGLILQHSKEKLNVYEKYLKAYLSIMINIPNFDKIYVIDPFAGQGISDNGEKGSALIAKGVIDDLDTISERNNKKIYLILNEYEKESYNSLIRYFSDKKEKIQIFNYDANIFIKNILLKNNNRGHRMFFIDPWGYTQIKSETYEQLFKSMHLELLIFIPTFNIYRFLRKNDNEQLKPIAQFLCDMGINGEYVKNVQTD
ncbi:MAG: three-Cys-motif partner protein TcmP, partial [Elusimicrobiota bacterium]|nr:three-Cys-motif partner protein TcmP [Elusimicrobiota bacterium]